MKVIWSDFASNMLSDIYQYYIEVAGHKVAQKIKSGIFQSTRKLIKHPNSGPTEELLKQLGEDHRFLVKGNYKIIYLHVKEGILITDVFDTRQDPIKINDEKRKH